MKNKLEREICDRLTVIERRLDNALSKQLEKQEGYLKPLEKTMKSRIEKLGHYEKDGKLFVIKHGEGGARTTLKVEPCKKGETPYALFYSLAIKLDEVIDQLNKQPEETEHIKLHKEVFCGVEDNPEQTEEEIRRGLKSVIYEYDRDERGGIGRGLVDVELVDLLVDYTKQLLEEREREVKIEVLKEILNATVDPIYGIKTYRREDIGKRLLEKLNKLNKDKNES